VDLNGLIGQIIEKALAECRDKSQSVLPLRSSYVMFKSLSMPASEDTPTTER
jgi:hypothetical protein